MTTPSLALFCVILFLVVGLATLSCSAQQQEPNYVRRTNQGMQKRQQEQRRRQADNSTSPPANTDIINGSPANPGEFPWFAAFEPLVSCGGSLIAPNRVLTAAHCIGSITGGPESVRIGSTTTTDGEVIKVCESVVHPNFYRGNQGDLFNDVAVLKLATSSSATPIALNSDKNYPSVSGTPLTVIGYGKTEAGGLSSRLKKLSTYFVDAPTCQVNYKNVDANVHVCADVPSAGDCQGDSGGPLFDASNKQIGVVSYGYGCAQDSPDIYAGVANYYSWIQEQINSETVCEECGCCCHIARFARRTYHRISQYMFGAGDSA